MASVSGAPTSRTLIDILPQFPRGKIEVGSVRLKPLPGVANIQSSSSRFPKLEECAHFHYDHVELPPMQLSVVDDQGTRGDFEGVTLQVTSGSDKWQLQRTYGHFCKLDEQLHQCVFDRKFSELPVLKQRSPKNQEETRTLLGAYVSRLSAIGSGCAISCGPALTWFELDNRGRRLVSAGNGINTPAVAAAFATTTYTAHANDELSFQTGDMISVIDMPPAEESAWWRGKRGFVVGFFPSNCVAVITDKIPNEIVLAGPTKPVLRKHGKLIAFFRAFILSRPSRRRLKQSGILRERVFGCDLSEHLLNTGRDIPLVLKCCADFIEAHGIVDGIYRLSGVTSNIQRLRSTFDEDRVPILTEDTGIRQDIHSVASLLKMYFRELPNPLCTYQLYDEFVGAVQSPTDKRLENMKKAVQKLPPPHYRTLEYLMGHLGRVCGHSTGTGMTARNVAIVWAPNLLRCKSLDQGVAALQGVGVQAVVTEFLILYAPLIFGSALQPGEGSKLRPKSLAVCTPAKLLPLHEAQVREQQSPTRSEIKGDAQTSYHTVLELPRKRQTLTWRAIFTPLRSNQGKSSHRVKHKNIVKSAEYLGGSKTVCGLPQGAAPAPSTHSRSVSHDSYFDTVLEQPSTSSLIDTQHEGLSLSLDLSELQMNFELEESEMKIFSEDETNQLFSSGTSIAFGALDTESNLEQRFSNQELRYIDSYSPDPMEAESISEDLLTPGYQPLLTPNSYENLKVTADNHTIESGNSSSKRSDTSPYAYEKLSESPNAGDDMQKKENDLYESCGDNNNTVNNNIYESMESEQEMYEPIVVMSDKVLYENEEVEAKLKSDNDESNIYEDVQLSPTEIYEQVSYLRSSVEEVNRLVEDKRSSISTDTPSISDSQSQRNTVSVFIQPSSNENIDKGDQSDTVYENLSETCLLTDEHTLNDDEGDPIYDVADGITIESHEPNKYNKQPDKTVTHKLANDADKSPSFLVLSQNDDKCCGPQKPNDSKPIDLAPCDCHSEKINVLQNMSEKNANVPEQYECVNFKEKIYDPFCETEYESVNFSTSAFVCENKSVMVEEDLIKNVEKNEGGKLNKESEPICDNAVSDKMNVECTGENLAKDRSLLKIAGKESFPCKLFEDNVPKRRETSSPKFGSNEMLVEVKKNRSKDSEQRMSQFLDNYKLDFQEYETKKTDKLRTVFEKENNCQSTKSLTEIDDKEDLNKSDNIINRNDVKKSDRTMGIEESEVGRRERIEKYKEERRSFFRNKFKTDNINNNDDDDELIRRIKQRTRQKEQREMDIDMPPTVRRRSSERELDVKKSPSKTTVTISYSPTRTKISGDWTPTKKTGSEVVDMRTTPEKTKPDEDNKNDTSQYKSGKEG